MEVFFKAFLAVTAIYSFNIVNQDFDLKITKKLNKRQRRIIHWIAGLCVWLIVFM